MKLFLFLILALLSPFGFAYAGVFDDDVGHDSPQVELVFTDSYQAMPLACENQAEQNLLPNMSNADTWSYHLLDFKEGLSQTEKTTKFIQDKTILNYWLSFGLSH